MKKFQIAGKRASESPVENFGARKKNFGAGNFFFGARIFSSRRQDFGAGLPQKVKIPHKTLHKGAVLCKKSCFFSLFCLASSKAVSRKSAQIRQKETCTILGVTFCQARVSSDTIPGSAATGLKAGAIGLSEGKTPPPYRGGGAKRRRGLTSTKAYFMSVPVGVKPLRPVGPAPLQGGAVASRRF